MKIKYFICLILLSACSNKYESLYKRATPPGLGFNKDTISIRERDYSNIAWTGNGRLSFYCKSPNNQLNLQLTDSIGKVHIMYRGEDMLNKGPLPVMDSILVFCSCDAPGLYEIDCLLTDRLGKLGEKKLFINCHSNTVPLSSFFFVPQDNNHSQNWPYHFDASLSRDPDGIIREYHFSINGQSIVTTAPFMDWSFHANGTHEIGLYVIDDLGKSSDTLYKQLIIQ